MLTSLALPEDSVSFRPELLLVSSRVKRDFKQPAVLEEPEELADNHGFVRIRERCLGDCMVDEIKGGGMDADIVKLFLVVSTE